ncbi:MAG: hypothetical protein FIA95_00400, partial [Gemmatimonadetes bacterium]|nr:hypothetical protein [Gemmatimonadota bacterium]
MSTGRESQDGRAEHVGGGAHGHGRPGWIRRLYNWVLHWADTPYGPAALIALAFAESSFFPHTPPPHQQDQSQRAP